MKFCYKCGKNLDDDAIFCTACGANQPQSTENVQNMENVQPMVNEQVIPQGFSQSFTQPSEQEMPASQMFNSYAAMPDMPKKKSKAPLIIGIVAGTFALVAAIVVVCLFAFGVIGSNSPKGIVKEYMEAAKDMDHIAMLECRAYSRKYKDEVKEMREDAVENLNEMGAMAALVEIEYKIGKIEKASSKEKREFWEDAEDYGALVDEKDIKDLRICEVKVSMSALGMEQEQKMIVYVGKYKGDWKIIGTEE